MKRAARSSAWRAALAASLLVLAGDAALAAPVVLQFLVKAQASDALPRCAADAADRCRADLDLPQVFAALRAMVAGGVPAGFAAATGGVAGVEVRLGRGRFRLSQALVLSGWEGAGRFGPLLIAGEGASESIVTGTLAVPALAWEPVAADERRVLAAARPHVRVADLRRLLPAPVDVREQASGFAEPVAPVPLEVYLADQTLTLARWPNSGWALLGPDTGLAPGPAQTTRVIQLRGAPYAHWRDEPALRAVGYFSHDWAFERMPASSDGSAEGGVVLGGSGAKFGVRAGQRVFVENALAELDSPGEWYFDAAQQRLYLWPPESAGAAEVEVAVASGLLRIAASNGVTVRGLGLQGARGDAVQISASQHVTLADAAIRNVAGRAVIVDGGSAVALRGLVISDVGEGGISVSGGNRHDLVAARHVVEACRIERFAQRSHSYRPAIAVEGVGIQILRNRIADGPHSAIVFGGNDHRIEGNHISDVVTETNDAGAIYTGRDWTARGTVITNNLLQNIYPRLLGTFSVMGIYLDDQASGATVSGNIFANVSRAVFIGGGRDNVVERNIFVASSPALFADNRGLSWQREQTQDANGQLRRNLRNMPVASIAYRSRYAHLADILDDEPGRSKYNRASDNLFVASRESEFIDGAESGLQRSGNRAVPWTVFKTLRATQPHYRPQDFELVAQEAGGFPRRDTIAP